MKLLPALLLLSLIPLMAFKKSGKKTVLVIQQSYASKKTTSGDTVFVQYGEPYNGYHVDDSVRVRCGADTANITTIFIAQPAGILKTMPFEKRFPNLKHLILAGNDEDYIDSVRYDFFNCPNLKRITISSIYMHDGPEGKRGDKAVKQFIHAARPDINVRFKPMNWRGTVGWPDH